MCEKAKDTQTVVQRNKDDPLPGKRLAILPPLGTSSAGKATAIDPHHHRQLCARSRIPRLPDIQRQAVLTWPGVVEDHVRKHRPLHAVVSEAFSSSNTLPALSRLRRLPTQRPYRRRRI